MFPASCHSADASAKELFALTKDPHLLSSLGWEARWADVALEDCPYEDEDAAHWRDGWLDADAMI